MYGIYITAIITTVLSLLIIGLAIFIKSRKQTIPLYAFAILLHIPIYFVAFYLVRLPLNDVVVKFIDPDSGLYLFLTIFYAPLTEEPAKWILLPLLLIPFIRRLINQRTAVRLGLAIGLGFGIGEMWLLANGIATVPEYAAMPFYMFTGYLSERLMVCFAHGALAAIVFSNYRRNLIPAMLFAMLLHYLLNFPIYLKIIGATWLSETAWLTLIQGHIVLFIAILLGITLYLAFRNPEVGRVLYGTIQCQKCGEQYPRPLWAIRFGEKRLERCLHCGKYGLNSAKDVIEDINIVRNS